MLAAHSWAALANAPVGIVASIKAAKAHFASRRHNFSSQTLLAPVRYPPRRRLIPTPKAQEAPSYRLISGRRKGVENRCPLWVIVDGALARTF